MNLSTKYLGLTLPHPLMAGASPLVHDVDGARRLEDAGSAAIVLHSLFEEQIALEQLAAHRHIHGPSDSYAEAATYFPSTPVFALGVDAYVEHLHRVRSAVHIPVIASLNGTTAGGWLHYARLLQQAGASALELNLYNVSTDAEYGADKLESDQLAMVRQVTAELRIPVAVKLSPLYTALPHFLVALADAGASGAILFNRFYQPDIDIESLDLNRRLQLSDPSELLLRLRFLAIASPQVGHRLSLACSGGVHSKSDVVKAIMAGAHAVQVVSVLLQRGVGHLGALLGELSDWMEAHEYESIDQLRGSMDMSRCPNPGAYERANYIQLLQGWHGRS